MMGTGPFAAAMTSCSAYAASATASSLDNDSELALFKDLVGRALTFVFIIAIGLAMLYWLSACVRYVTEDSDDAARKHILKAAAGVFVAVSAKKLVGFVVNGIFPDLAGDVPSGQAAAAAVFRILGLTITFILTVCTVLIACYCVVIAVKLATQDNPEALKRHLVRGCIGLLCVVTARIIMKWAVGTFL